VGRRHSGKRVQIAKYGLFDHVHWLKIDVSRTRNASGHILKGTWLGG